MDFDVRLDDFLSYGIRIAGVTTEPLSEVASLKGAKHLTLTLCSDPLGIASSLYGVRNAYGFADRYTFLISKEGEVLQVWDAYSTTGHAEDVLGQCRRTFRR
jgi:peroxiredoxin